MFNLNEEIERLLEKYPLPGAGPEEVVEASQRRMEKIRPPCLGLVADNKDPDCLGRIRVTLDMISPGSVSGWLPIVNKWASKKSGWWQLPEIGVQALVAFLGSSVERAVVLGFIFDEKHKPPAIHSALPNESIVYQCKKHRMEIVDEEGKEVFMISSAQGKMRFSMSKEKGIELINELGDIRIKCRKLTIEGGENVNFQAKKKLSISVDGNLETKSKKKTVIESEKEVKIQGKNIILNGSKGVTSGGKQIACEENAVMGFDIHQMEIPAGTSTAVVPLPHPFIGKLKDKLAKDVKIGKKNAAVKGSVAKHGDSMHLQLPGTIKFVQNPKKEGEVTGGTASKLKINGKEAAVIGSQVTTCNDIGAQNNSTIMAVGMCMPMPTIINPENTAEYEAEREKQEKKERKFTSVKWSKTSAQEGEELTLTAQVQDIDDGNMVTLQVWTEGADPASGIALKRIPVTISGGSAEGKWSYRLVDADKSPESDPGFTFSAHSAWCAYKMSEKCTIKLKRPQITRTDWKDNEGKSASKGKIDKPIHLCAETKELDDGKTVTFAIYRQNQNPFVDIPVKKIEAQIKNNKAQTSFYFDTLLKPVPINENLYNFYRNKGYDIPRDQFEYILEDYKDTVENEFNEKPKYFMTANAQRCAEIKSGSLELSQDIRITVCDMFGNGKKNIRVKIKEASGKEYSKSSDENGEVVFEDLIPGQVHVEIKREKQK